jgi:hypothetical protein
VLLGRPAHRLLDPHLRTEQASFLRRLLWQEAAWQLSVSVDLLWAAEHSFPLLMNIVHMGQPQSIG